MSKKLQKRIIIIKNPVPNLTFEGDIWTDRGIDLCLDMDKIEFVLNWVLASLLFSTFFKKQMFLGSLVAHLVLEGHRRSSSGILDRRDR